MGKINYISNIKEHKAERIKYTIGSDILSGNTQPIGSTTLETLRDNEGGNVQSAINDVIGLTQLVGVGGVYTCIDGISPAPIAQIDNYKFSGTVEKEGYSKGDSVVLNFYGIVFTAKVGDTVDVVIPLFLESARKIMADIGVFNTLTVSASDPTASLEAKYLDFQAHNLKPIASCGILLTPTILSPVRQGYGTWTALGNIDVSFTQSPDVKKLYYFVRTS